MNDLTKLITSGKKPVKKIVRYVQPARLCTYCSNASALAYNVGIELSPRSVENIGIGHTIANAEQTAKIMLERIKNKYSVQSLDVYQVDTLDWVRRGYHGIVLSLSVTDSFYGDFYDNGVINKALVKKLGVGHAIFAYKRVVDKKVRIFLLNSWRTVNGIYEADITDEIEEGVKCGAIKKTAIIIA